MLRLSIASCMFRLRLSIGSCMLRLRLSSRGSGSVILTWRIEVGLEVGPKVGPQADFKSGTKSAPKLASTDRLFRTNVANISRAVPYNVRKQHRFQAIATMGQTSYLGVSNVPPDILCAWFAFVEMVTPRGVCSSARAVRSRLCSLCSKGLVGVSFHSVLMAHIHWLF